MDPEEAMESLPGRIGGRAVGDNGVRRQASPLTLCTPLKDRQENRAWRTKTSCEIWIWQQLSLQGSGATFQPDKLVHHKL